MNKVTTVGIDLAKRVSVACGVSPAGWVVLRRLCRRDELPGVVAQSHGERVRPAFRRTRSTRRQQFNAG